MPAPPRFTARPGRQDFAADVPNPVPAMPADPESLEAHVRMLAETLVPRDAHHPAMLDRVATYVTQELDAPADEVTNQPYTVGSRVFRNVIARFGPATRERILVGAHYDAAGPYPGADDNASGVAGLIELGRLLADTSLPMRVELVSYPLEEPPYFRTRHMGSAVHARSMRRQNVAVRAMLALEMIGYFSDAPRSQRFPLFLLRPFYPSTGSFIAVVSKWGQGGLARTVRDAMRAATPLPAYSLSAPRLLPGVSLSDHASYWDEGYDALMITDTAFFRNPHYHAPSDTPDTLDYERMAQVVDGVQAAVQTLAE